MESIRDVSSKLWKSFYKYVKLLATPVGSEQLSIGCETLVKWMEQANEDVTFTLAGLTFVPLDFNVAGKAWNFSAINRVFEELFSPPQTHPGTVTYFQLFDTKLNSTFLENVWLTTDYDQVIIDHYQGSLPFPQQNSYTSPDQKLRIVKSEEKEAQPISLTFIQLPTTNTGYFLLQDRLEENPRDKILIVQETTPANSSTDRASPLHDFYRALVKIYQLDKLPFPKTAQNFLLYLFQSLFSDSEREQRQWINFLENRLNQCRKSVSGYL